MAVEFFVTMEDMETHGGLPRNRYVSPLRTYAVMHAARALHQGGESCGGFGLGKYICHAETTLDLDDGFHANQRAFTV